MQLRHSITGAVSTVHSRLPAPVLRFVDVLTTSRILGLSAECAFWITFTLPWIALGILSSVGAIASRADPEAVVRFQQAVLSAASTVLTPAAADAFLAPLVQEIGQGRTDLTVLGVVIALWSGSRMVRSVAEGVRVVHGTPRPRGYAWTRGLAVLLYLLALISAGVVVALMAVGPQWLGRLSGMATDGSVVLTYGLLCLVTIGLILALYQTAVPVRAPIRLDLLGATVAVIGWLVGSAGLHFYTGHLFSDFSVYAAVAAPIAIMLWSFVTAFVVLAGAAVSVVLAFPSRFGTPASAPSPPPGVR